jgi:uncharacterized glyoxalase superfamily protein PhnB
MAIGRRLNHRPLTMYPEERRVMRILERSKPDRELHPRGVGSRPMLGGRCTAILKTTDVAATLDWYRRVGFEVRDVFPDDGEPSWCEVSRDGVVLQFLGGDTPWPGPPAFTGTLYLHPESVDALFEQIKEHTTPAWGPEDREWGTRELGLRDPNGYFLTFTEPA